MKTILRSLLVMLPLFAMLAGGCATRAVPFKGNEVLVRPNGQMVLKGLGGASARSYVCTVNPGAYGSESSQKTSGELDIVKYVSAKVSNETANKSILLYLQTERLAALDTILTQMCIAYGNEAFGPVGTPEAAAKYTQQITDLLKVFAASELVLAPPAAPAPIPEPAPRS